MHVPYLSSLQFNRINLKDLGTPKILQIRDEVMTDVHETVQKHLFFFVFKYDKNTLNALSRCIIDIQGDQKHFNSTNYEVHVVCNFMDDALFSADEYEKAMPCLTNNNVCVYSWFLGQYDHNGDKLVSDKRRAHAISRMVSLVCNHSEIASTIIPMTLATEKAMPVYHLFGDASVFFDEESRTHSIRNYYGFKSVQQLLNLPDNRLDEYMRNNVIPYENDKKELDKRIDVTSEEFLKQQCVSIEASLITEKTQDLLLKSSEEDEDYLVNATDNKLVFLDKLSKSDGWQLENMDVFLTEYQDKVLLDNELQESVSDEFLEKLYNEKYTIHERNDFDKINNKVSDSRKIIVEQFEEKVNRCLNSFIDQSSNENEQLFETLTVEETRNRPANIDHGIAFLEYLESGKSDYLKEEKVSMGDINFKIIKETLEKEEDKRCLEYRNKKNEIDEKYVAKVNGQPSEIKKEIDSIDQNIAQCRKEKNYWDYQLQHLVDEDSEKKLTEGAKALIAVGSGVVAAIVWLLVMQFLLIFGPVGVMLQWVVFGGFLLAGVVVGAIIFAKALHHRKEAEEALMEVRQRKRNFMDACVKEIEKVTELHYNHLLAFHGLKTMMELMEYAAWKKEDLISFRKTLFRLMCRYKLAIADKQDPKWDDDNTIELFDDMNVQSLLFGAENTKKEVPYCFAQGGAVLSETFAEFKRKKARWKTTRNTLSHTSQSFDQASLEKETIACMRKHVDAGIEYTTLKGTSILPLDANGIEIDDIHQGFCGDCYFMATLAAIARMRPEYIIGKNGMVEELGDEHRFFRVKFYDKDGKRVNVDVDNRFWNRDGRPFYAKEGKSDDPEGNSYDPWVMAVEKAWAKANDDGYDGIEGTSISQERMRRVEYSFAVTGKSAFYCQIKNAVDSDKLVEKMRKHFCEEKLPIVLYSVDEKDAKFADPNLVKSHAYALRSLNNDGTFDIFNPWNSHGTEEDIEGIHYEKVGIDFIKKNFDVVVFFGIQEAAFDSFERDLTQNAPDDEVAKGIEKTLDDSFAKLKLSMRQFEDLLTEEGKRLMLTYSEYLFSKNNIKDPRGEEGSGPLLFMEGIKMEDCKEVNDNVLDYLKEHCPNGISLQPVLCRDDHKQSLTLFRLSPHYVLSNFQFYNEQNQ